MTNLILRAAYIAIGMQCVLWHVLPSVVTGASPNATIIFLQGFEFAVINGNSAKDTCGILVQRMLSDRKAMIKFDAT